MSLPLLRMTGGRDDLSGGASSLVEIAGATLGGTLLATLFSLGLFSFWEALDVPLGRTLSGWPRSETGLGDSAVAGSVSRRAAFDGVAGQVGVLTGNACGPSFGGGGVVGRACSVGLTSSGCGEGSEETMSGTGPASEAGDDACCCCCCCCTVVKGEASAGGLRGETSVRSRACTSPSSFCTLLWSFRRWDSVLVISRRMCSCENWLSSCTGRAHAQQ